MKKYIVIKFLSFMLVCASIVAVLAACGRSVDTNTTSMTKINEPTQTTPTTQSEATETKDPNYGLPYALFYNPNYRQLTERERQIVTAFSSILAFGNPSEQLEIIRNGTFIFHSKIVQTDKGVYAHPIYWTTRNGNGPHIIYMSDEIYQRIELVLKRSAEYLNVSGNAAYRYKYGALFNGEPYDEHEVNVLQASLYENYLVGYYKDEFKEFFSTTKAGIEEYNNLDFNLIK